THPESRSAASTLLGTNSRLTAIGASSSRRQNYSRATRSGFLAFGVLEPDLTIHQVVAAFDIFLLHAAAADHLRTRLIHPTILHGKLAQPSEFARKIGHQLPEKGVLQRAVENHARKVILLREILIIMDLVEVAGCTRVLHQLLCGWVFFQRPDLRPHYN